MKKSKNKRNPKKYSKKRKTKRNVRKLRGGWGGIEIFPQQKEYNLNKKNNNYIIGGWQTNLSL